MSDMLETLSDRDLLALAKQALQEDFHRLHPAWVERHILLLTTLRKIFGNDLDKPIILGIIGQVMFAQHYPNGESYASAFNRDEKFKYPLLTNIESISLSSGIPRETVRRKIYEMLETGWVGRDAKGRVFVTNKATQELDQATQITFSLLADMFVRITKSMDTKNLIRIRRVTPANDD
jgi:hypothetical protein